MNKLFFLCQSEWVICRVFTRKPPGETSLEETVLHHPPHLNNDDDHVRPSIDGSNGGETPAAVAAASDHEHATNSFSDALAVTPADHHHHHESACQGVLQLNLNHEELLMMNHSVSDYASAAAWASELLQPATLLRHDELCSDSIDDLLPQLLDYEGLPFLQDF